MQNIQRTIGCDHCHLIYFCDSELIWSIENKWYRAMTLSGLTGHCAETGDIIRVSDVTNESRFNRYFSSPTYAKFHLCNLYIDALIV
jgi:hypothetical protein